MPNYLDHKVLVEEGYLQEVNRQFLHPHGLALTLVKPESDAEERTLLRVLDYRDDPEGLTFSDKTDLKPKADNIYRIEGERYVARKKAVGWWVQPPRA